METDSATAKFVDTYFLFCKKTAATCTYHFYRHIFLHQKNKKYSTKNPVYAIMQKMLLLQVPLFQLAIYNCPKENYYCHSRTQLPVYILLLFRNPWKNFI